MSQAKKKATDNRKVDTTPSPQDVARGGKGRRTVFIIASVVIVIILIIVGVSYYLSESARYSRLTIITVDDTTIKMGYFIKRTQLAGADPMVMLEVLTKEQLIKLDAPQYVKEVTPEDIDQELRRQSETVSEGEFKEWYRQLLNETGLSDSEYKELVATSMLAARLHQSLAERVPTVAEHVHLHAIVLKTYEDAEKIRVRLEAGENFADLAREVSLDEVTKENGGDLGWLPRGVMDYRFDYVAFSLNPGEVSEPLPYMPDPSSPEGARYYLFMVSEKDAARELDEGGLQILKGKVLEDWLLERMEFHEIKYNFNSEIYAWINWQLMKTSSEE